MTAGQDLGMSGFFIQILSIQPSPIGRGDHVAGTLLSIVQQDLTQCTQQLSKGQAFPFCD